MIYITYKTSPFTGELTPNNVYNVDCKDVKQKYIDFMHQKANEINIVINPHWLNIMAREGHHDNLTLNEYFFKKKQWRKIQKEWNIDNFICKKSNGKKELYYNLF